MTDNPRLIEVAFPLKQTSLDSVHEKNVRHGHISTLHIWPARRPLAACRAALIATLLPDPGTPDARRILCERIGGKVVKVSKKKTSGGKTEERLVEETVGGILHWGREAENKDDLDWFRAEIRKAYGGKAPKVLDPFAGGGAIPLEAMRLGCEATAIDINPVAWFILKCTLEYPQKLAGQKRRLPDFALRDREFMAEFFAAAGFKKPQIRTFLKDLGLQAHDPTPPLTGFGGENVDGSFLEADLAWHVRAWGRWVLAHARRELAEYYPIYADFQPLQGVDAWREQYPQLRQSLRPVPVDASGIANVDAWNDGVISAAFKENKPFKTDLKYRAEMCSAYLEDQSKPRWVMKPAVAYLWARTVKCKNCRATIPLLKTRWLAKRERKRVLLNMEANADKTGVVFSVQPDVLKAGGNNAIRREHDRKLGQGTMSRAGVWCPCCGRPGTVAMEMEDIRQQGLKNHMGAAMTAVVVDGPDGKEYRLPTAQEVALAAVSEERLQECFKDVPFGIPMEFLPGKEALGIRIPLYGLTRWRQLFTPRQLLALGTFVKSVRATPSKMDGYPVEWTEAVAVYLACVFDRMLDFNSVQVSWITSVEAIGHTFVRYALPITWDYSESATVSYVRGGWLMSMDAVLKSMETVRRASNPDAPSPIISCESAKLTLEAERFDAIVTDPPYYDAISYSDLMDYFHVWDRRLFAGTAFGSAFERETGPKWDSSGNDGELIDDSSRHNGNAAKSKQVYEDGMAQVFQRCAMALRTEGRLVVVFANKQPAAWETLVAAIVRAGFAVDGSWPIQTEQAARMRAQGSAALASSVWLVCKKRSPQARPGWDREVLKDMQSNINGQLRMFWDAGIRGPDFVWAATGPAMEAYSKHPIVKKADTPGELMGVREFLQAVRRLVVNFVVGRVLSGEERHSGSEVGPTDVSGLDDVTTYYLLHRHDFGMDDAPAGACILYAVSCNLSENELADRFDLLVRTGGLETDGDEELEGSDADAEPDDDSEAGSGSTFKLKSWKQRTRPGLGIDHAAESARVRNAREKAQPRLFEGSEPIAPIVVPKSLPLIDQAHHLMHVWIAGDLAKVNTYIDDHGLRRNMLFQKLLQALIELSPEGSEEKRVLEVIMNHFRDLGVTTAQTMVMKFENDPGEPAGAGTGS